VDAFMCYKQKCKVVSFNLAHPVYCFGYESVCKIKLTTLGFSVHQVKFSYRIVS